MNITREQIRPVYVSPGHYNGKDGRRERRIERARRKEQVRTEVREEAR